ncbi:MFS transporter [Pikeienuella piscinae]|uniref:MFS transporter n=1 Tax=Pikeienuella piscinae TaxID=2748098 RepID=A0A7L5BUF1_9RHOB|nr:MFS transporter [Pikeienuella piscinae]QIE54007.1 MFS transporter [Pikeienuella piscinae]
MKASDRAPILGLAVAETLVWAGLFYTFPILLLRWEGDFGWGRDVVALGFTLALGVSALSAPIAGRVIDSGRGALMLPVAALFGGVFLVALSLVESQAGFFALWALIGAANAFCLYEPCFAFLTRVKGAEARGPITLVTLVAGFASTIAFPLADVIADAAGWRAALRVFAALVILVAAPLFYWSARRLAAGGPARPSAEAGRADRAAARRARSTAAFWLLAAALPVIALTHGMLISHLMPILGSRGATGGTAVFAAALIGPAQVAGRIFITLFARRTAGIGLILGAYGVTGASYLLLLSAAGPDWRIFLAIIALGAANGIGAIAKPLAIAEILGRAGFGAISGALATPFIAGFAAAPFLAALLWRAGGYDLMLAAAAVMVLCGIGLLALARRSARRTH